MIIGVTATQQGLTDRQKRLVREELIALGATELHHGDCIGGDADIHQIAVELDLYIIIHPPRNESKRAFCEAHETRRALEYLDRNKNIVLESNFLIGCPRYNREELRSGTWSTIRFARRIAKDYVVILPIQPKIVVD